MTLTELIKEEYDDLNSNIVEICKKVSLTYARSIIPEEKKTKFVCINCNYHLYLPENIKCENCKIGLLQVLDRDLTPWNACRTQILSRIEEDSK